MSDPSVAHVTVLADEVVEALRPALQPAQQDTQLVTQLATQPAEGPDRGSRPPRVLIDATAGLGGHTLALLRATAPTRAILFDRDPEALAQARARLDRELDQLPCPIDFVHAGFATLAESLARLGVQEVAAIVADLGVSSMQLDQPERGFSFRGEGPLDMRMDPTQGRSAAELLAEIDAERLARILREHGEEPDAKRIAAAIVRARPTTTRALAEVVADAMSGRQRRKLGVRIHPATRTFMALRIEVNDELGQLDRFLADAPSLLMVGGRLAVITFHSLEDRRVKRRWQALGRPPQPPAHLPLAQHELPRPRFGVPRGYERGVVPSDAEIEANPRARSARLRVLERLSR